MPAINLTKTQMNSGVRQALKVFKESDASRGGLISPAEVKKYRGPGAAQLRAVFAYAQNIENSGSGSKSTSVSYRTAERALKNLNSALDKIAASKGDKDNRLDGNELKYASKAAAALARFTHANID
ncbi:MAG: hypothetical protein JNK82_32590 [Myxococcaceae bacterium]|nr:hypothetical protein [Myxococcaceae bacterium]